MKKLWNNFEVIMCYDTLNNNVFGTFINVF